MERERATRSRGTRESVRKGERPRREKVNANVNAARKGGRRRGAGHDSAETHSSFNSPLSCAQPSLTDC